jgi:hypothetical protein
MRQELNRAGERLRVAEEAEERLCSQHSLEGAMQSPFTLGVPITTASSL